MNENMLFIIFEFSHEIILDSSEFHSKTQTLYKNPFNQYENENI